MTFRKRNQTTGTVTFSGTDNRIELRQTLYQGTFNLNPGQITLNVGTVNFATFTWIAPSLTRTFPVFTVIPPKLIGKLKSTKAKIILRGTYRVSRKNGVTIKINGSGSWLGTATKARDSITLVDSTVGSNAVIQLVRQ